MVPDTPTVPPSTPASDAPQMLEEQDHTTAVKHACCGLMCLDTIQTREILAVLEAFLAAFKDIRSGGIPFLDELAEAWKKLDSTAADTPEEEKRRVLREIVQKYNAESSLAMNMLLKNSQAFFTTSISAITVGEARLQEQAAQHATEIQRMEVLFDTQKKEHATEIQRMEALLDAQKKEQQEQEKACEQTLEQHRQASNLKLEQLKTKMTEFLSVPTPLLPKNHYKNFIESLIENDLNP